MTITKKRSMVKSLSWRVVAFIILAITSYLFTGNIKDMSRITLTYTFVQLIIYYLHERIWDKIKWGTIRHPLSNIPVNKELTDKDKEVIVDKLKDMGYL